MSSLLDQGQVIRNVHDEVNKALNVKGIAGGLVTEPYDYIVLTYVPSGNGAGQIQTATYKNGGSSGTTVAVLTLAYDSGNNLISVTKS